MTAGALWPAELCAPHRSRATARHLHCRSYARYVSLSWSELARRTWREAIDDDVLGLAAQLSYYFFLALFPAILFLLALASFFPLSNLTDDSAVPGPVCLITGPRADSGADATTRQQRERRTAHLRGPGALWSSSAAIVSIVGALNRAYDIEEGRPWWKVRLIAIGLTLGVAAIVLVALVAGPRRTGRRAELGHATGWGAPFEWAWLVLQWPLVFVLVTTGIGLDLLLRA